MHLAHAFPLSLVKARANVLYVLAWRIIADGYVIWPFKQRIVCHLIDHFQVFLAPFLYSRSKGMHRPQRDSSSDLGHHPSRFLESWCSGRLDSQKRTIVQLLFGAYAPEPYTSAARSSRRHTRRAARSAMISFHRCEIPLQPMRLRIDANG